MRTTTSLPDAEAVPPAALVAAARGGTIVATATGDTAACPVCAQPSARRV